VTRFGYTFFWEEEEEGRGEVMYAQTEYSVLCDVKVGM